MFRSYSSHKSTLEAGLNLSSGATVVYPQIRYRYFVNDAFALRAVMDLATQSEVERVYQNENFTGNEGTKTVSTRSLGLQTGFEYHPYGTKRLSPYFGLTVGLTFGRDKEVWKDYNDTLGIPGTGFYDFQTNAEIKAPFFAFQTGAVAGLDFYLIENLYMGVEMNWNFVARNNNATELSYSDANGISLNETIAPSSREVTTQFGALPAIRLGWRF